MAVRRDSMEMASLPAADGAASSVLFGAVSLVSVLPGLWPLVVPAEREPAP